MVRHNAVMNRMEIPMRKPPKKPAKKPTSKSKPVHKRKRQSLRTLLCSLRR